jgi:hypothetical protein
VSGAGERQCVGQTMAEPTLAAAELELAGVLGDFKKILNSTLSLCCVKLIWHHRMEHGTDTYRLDVVDPVTPPRHVMTISATPTNLKSHLEGFLIDIRRALINDLFLCVARHSVLARNIVLHKRPLEPEFYQESHEGEILALGAFLTKEDKQFLDFFRRVRNATVHYNGNHNVRNRLDFEFNGTHFLTTEKNVGAQIGYWFSDLFAIHNQLESIFAADKVMQHPHLTQQMAARYVNGRVDR